MWGRRAVAWLRPRVVRRVKQGISRINFQTCLSTVSATIAEVVYSTGEICVTWVGGQASTGDYVVTTCGPAVATAGSSLPLRWVPVGTRVSHVGDLAHSAGTNVQVLRHRDGQTQCCLPSGRLRWLSSDVTGVIGHAGNSTAKHVVLSSAGDSWRLGRLPRTRGTAMNPIDHPHGGGQGKTSGGGPARTPWGRLTKGKKTACSVNRG